MKRTLIILVAATMAALVVVAAPAAGKKGGNKPTTTTTVPTVLDCSFVDGVLWVMEEGQDAWMWDETRGGVRCRWEVAEEYLDNETLFEFVMTGSGRVQIPHLTVMDIYPYGGDGCTNPWGPGWHNLPYSFTPFTLPAVDSPDGCADGNSVPDTDGPTTFSLTVYPQKIRGDDVRLEWLNEVP